MNFLSKNKGVFQIMCWKTGLNGVFSGLILAGVLMTQAAYAEDSLVTVMQSMQSEQPVKIAYQEIRRLELMDEPWFASGYLYSLPPDIMIKEQLEPQRILMGVKADKLFYFDTKNNVRHQAEMDMDNPLNQNIAVFNALIHADTDLLKRLFQIEFSHFPQRWLMTLHPIQQSQRDISIAVSGRLKQGVDLIKIQQADGDVTEFLLQKQIPENHIEKKINQLYLELQGE